MRFICFWLKPGADLLLLLLLLLLCDQPLCRVRCTILVKDHGITKSPLLCERRADLDLCSLVAVCRFVWPKNTSLTNTHARTHTHTRPAHFTEWAQQTNDRKSKRERVGERERGSALTQQRARSEWEQSVSAMQPGVGSCCKRNSFRRCHLLSTHTHTRCREHDHTHTYSKC